MGWNAMQSVRTQVMLPKAHHNYEKQTLNYIDKKSSQQFVEQMGGHS